MKTSNTKLGMEMFKEIDGITYKLCTKCLKYKPMTSEYFYKRDKVKCGYELDNGRVFTNVSVDLKNPGQGYTKENILLVCSAVNLLKSNWDMDTVIYVCKQIINNYEN